MINQQLMKDKDMEKKQEELDQALIDNLVKIKLQIDDHERTEKIKERVTLVGGCLLITVKLALYAAIIGLAIHFLF